jgi:hypothetical protein
MEEGEFLATSVSNSALVVGTSPDDFGIDQHDELFNSFKF